MIPNFRDNKMMKKIIMKKSLLCRDDKVRQVPGWKRMINIGWLILLNKIKLIILHKIQHRGNHDFRITKSQTLGFT